MHFIKLGKKYINLDNVTTIEEKGEGLGYAVCFVGLTNARSICEMDMADIRREFEKIEKLKNLDVITLKNPE